MPPVDMCSCASDGVSGGISTGRLGCQDHAHGFGSIGAFCMVVGGPACSESHPSIAFAGASWKQCTTVDQSQMVRATVTVYHCFTSTNTDAKQCFPAFNPLNCNLRT